MTIAHSKRYPSSLKESVARRYLSQNMTFQALADEVGADRSTVRGWVLEYRKQGSVGRKSEQKRRSGSEKLRLLFEAKKLSDAELGEFLRREGLREGELEAWEKEALGGLSNKADDAKDARLKELERERARQDKRLKEAEALLDLQKKVHALWGDEDDDTDES